MRDLERGNRKWSQAIFHLPSFYEVLWKWWLSMQHQLCGGYLRCSLIFFGDITVLASVLNRFKYRSYSSGFNHNTPRTKSNENQKTYFVIKCILVHGGKPIFLHSCFSCISPWVICSCLYRQLSIFSLKLTSIDNNLPVCDLFTNVCRYRGKIMYGVTPFDHLIIFMPCWYIWNTVMINMPVTRLTIHLAAILYIENSCLY